MVARGRIVDAAIAGQLVGFLPVLAPALPVSLSRQRAVAAERPPDLPERKREVDEREHVVDAMRLLLGAARGEDHRGPRVAEHARGLDELASAERPSASRRARASTPPRAVSPRRILRCARDVVGVDQAVANEQMQEPVGQRRVGTRAQTQMQLRPLARSPIAADRRRSARRRCAAELRSTA